MQSVESLTLKGFAGIRAAEIELSRMNVFIGPQASGKSVSVKLVYYFRDLISHLPSQCADGKSRRQIESAQKRHFLKCFPPLNWGKEAFSIRYSFGCLWIEIEREPKAPFIDIKFSDCYNALVETCMEASRVGRRKAAETRIESDADVLATTRSAFSEHVIGLLGAGITNRQSFVPAGRSFFSTINSSIYNLIADGVPIDYFVANFGSLFHSTLRAPAADNSTGRKRQSEIGPEIAERIRQLLSGTYRTKDNRDVIETLDGRLVALENSSSGQQEMLPLALFLAMLSTAGSGKSTTLFVEEPEAHLYPTAQRDIVNLVSLALDLSSEEASSECIITTHSPFILSAINNLMLGYSVAAGSETRKQQVTDILECGALIDPTKVKAYLFEEGGIRSIINPETGLIQAEALDQVSDKLAKEFGRLLEIRVRA